jgi:FAD/FMN-containing dehydrogenase/Fe-S oxidoreductase
MSPPLDSAAPATSASPLDATALAQALERTVPGEIRFDHGSRALYASDASNYRQLPIGVVVPHTVEALAASIAVCREFGAPVLTRGTGTSLCGQTCNAAVVHDASKYLNRIVSVDPQTRLAIVEPGVVCDRLRDAAEVHRLTFGPDPATHSRCTLGGMIGNNSCGAHSVMAGKTVENIEALEVLTYDGLRMWVGPTPEAELEAIIAAGGRRGEIYAGLKAIRDRYGELVRAQFPKIRRRVSGYNLDALLPENGFDVARALVGTEGTCVTVLHAKAKLVYSPPVRVMVVLGYPDIYIAGDRTPFVLEHQPVALEGLDQAMIEDMKRKRQSLDDIALLPACGAWLLTEIGADTPDEAAEIAQRLIASERAAGALSDVRFHPAAQDVRKVWAIREVGAGACNAVPGEPVEPHAGWEDAAVDPHRVGDYLREFRKLLDKYHYRCSLYGHFGDGCIHGRITFDFRTSQGVAHFRNFLAESTDLVVKYGGSISGEHGDGQARAEFLPRMYSPEIMQAFREFKRLWDPQNKMNPGKVIDPYRVDQNLRYGPDYKPLQPATRFSFANDFGSFAHATERCHGIGKCRNTRNATMCPSYRATGEEKYSTRGRARLLSEMIRGDSLTGLWQNEAVKDALDLCLACKGCKGDCPVQVDMATYKAEFLSHYYEGRLRPRQAYSMGLIQRWARLASHVPWLVNFVTQTPGLSAIAKRLAGIARERTVPQFAPRSFKKQINKRAGHADGSRRVILWADTFNNYFHPETALAAADVLEAAGYRVTVPHAPLCCGRPLYDFGMLDTARRQLQQIMRTLASDIAAGVPIIGLEPACVAVFKDELLNLFPDDAVARRLSESVHAFSDFILASGWQPPRPLGEHAVVHGHCHQKALWGMNSEARLLEKLGVDFKLLDSGCCGMAGSFGFNPDHYDISIKVGEQVLLPAVRAAAPDTLIVANGYSCREQIAQCTGRRALHVAEVARMTLTGTNEKP